MKKTAIAITSLLLSLLMMSSCTTTPPADGTDTNDGSTAPVQSEPLESSEGTKESDTEAQTSPSDTDSETETDISGEVSESETEEKIELEGEHAELIENANALKNSIGAYFSDDSRSTFILENNGMSLEYALRSYSEQQIMSLKNKNGNAYITNTSDVFVKMKDGSTFYASASTTPTSANLYRLGYYYYEARFEEQNFDVNVNVNEGFAIGLDCGRYNCKTNVDDNGELHVQLLGKHDPYVTFKNVNFSADEYGYIQITLKTDATAARSCQFFLKAGGKDNFSEAQSKTFTVSPSEGYETYVVPIHGIADYQGDVTALRLDFANNAEDKIDIKEIRIVKKNPSPAPQYLGLNRSFLVYPDKLHHFLQVSSADVPTENVAEIGLVTGIAADTVDKLIIKDKNGTHEALEGVDFATVEYVGFDIKDAGVFGYILPADNSGGTLTVTLENGYYVLTQSRAPENNTILPSGIYNSATGKIEPQVSLNGNDFFMGQRFYTDENHSFEAFLKEAELERNPLGEENFIIDTGASANASYVGYDAIRGIYTFKVECAGFNGPYFQYPNKYYNVKFTVKGDGNDRHIYVLSSSDKTGCLECAVLLDKNEMLLPIPVQVGKNFSEAKLERNRWNIDDAVYCEAIIPMPLKSGSEATYTIANLYQNWGRFPLKQISWIQASAPCYHLSTGVIETNCITGYYSTRRQYGTLNTLPDHRTMSAPLWYDQPQHNSAGSHTWLIYTDAEGRYNATEYLYDSIGSYGPIYADITMNYISYDEKIKVTYNHMEFPQTDENRGFYRMEYEVLEDVNIADFKKDWQFYAVAPNDPTGVYQKVGYLNSDNECTIAKANSDKDNPVSYILGNECPYISFFDMANCTSTSQQGYGNLSFLIYRSEFIIGGEKQDPSFILTDLGGKLVLSLNLGEVSLKAGDRFAIDAIIMPWGSQESVYDSNEFAGDQNVRNVRQNTLLNPVTVTAGKNTEAMESIFLPKIKTANGKTAEFTITGGHNNIPVRIYGFDKLTSPVIEEKVNGEWVPYNVSSAYYPDTTGNAHYYDGYAVYYDGDGTYSYSFVIDMDEKDNDGRTFRVNCSQSFESWPDELPDLGITPVELPLNVYVEAEKLFESATLQKQFGNVEMMDDGKYVRFTPDESKIESVFTPYPGGTPVTGQYFVMKYRLPEENTHKLTAFELYTSTVNDTAKAGDGFAIGNALLNDGKWHTVIIDLSTWKKESFAPDADGKYGARYLRIDVFNNRFPVTNRFDMEYAGISDNIEDILALCQDEEYVNLAVMSSGAIKLTYHDPKTGNEIPKPEEEIVIKDAVADVKGYSAYFTAEELYNLSKTNGSEHRGERELADDASYARFHICTDESTNEAYRKESYINVYKPKDVVATGQYLVIKYRAERQIGLFQVYASTEQDKAASANCISVDGASGAFVGDGEWQTLVIDMAKFKPDAFKPINDGRYCPLIIRFDMFNLGQPLTAAEATYVDLAYIGITTDYTLIDLDEGAVLYDGSVTEIKAE